MAKIDRQYLRNLVNGLQDISPEDRSQLLQLVNEEKRYGLVWEDKPEEAEQIMKEKLPIIEEVEDKRILNDTSEEKYPNHIIIEGDNLHALTTLCYTHEGKVDVIYIDPPYNTGNKDFKYNDNYVDKEDAYRHSKWLSFMHRRLKLAKRLLSDRGVIFISIDDNEQAQLKLLCDSVLGGGNFLGVFIRKTVTQRAMAKFYNTQHEYCMLYCRKKECFSLLGKEKDISVYKNPDNDINGAWKTLDPSMKGSNNIFGIENPFTHKKDYPPMGRGWAFSEQRMNDYIQSGKIIFKKYYKERERGFIYKGYKKDLKSQNLLLNSLDFAGNSYLNQIASKEIIDVFANNIFDYSKPSVFIHDILLYNKEQDITVLDFFAGSGTTLHATMQLNNEDGGNRQCILVTNNENNICEEVTYERNKRVIQGYTNQKGESVEGLKKNNLRYYKIKAVGREKTLKNKKTLVALSCGMLNIKENIYKEEKHFGSLLLKKNKCRYFSQGQKQMLVIIDEEWIAKIVEQLKTMEVKEPIKIYVFSNSGYAWDDDFSEVGDKVMPCALPEAIYKAYKNILPEREDKIIDTGEEKTLTAAQEEELLRMYEKAMQEEE